MSSQQFNLEFLVKVTGGPLAISQINGVRNALTQQGLQIQNSTRQMDSLNTTLITTGTSMTSTGRNVATMGREFTATVNPIRNTGNALNQFNENADKVTKGANNMGKGVAGAARSYRGLIFGLTGLTSSLVEAVGMYQIYQDAETRVKEAQAEVNQLVAEGKTETQDYRNAVNELAQAERAMNMVRRNTILSFFDMVTWVSMTVNGLTKIPSVMSKVNSLFNIFRGTATTTSAATGALATSTLGLSAAQTTATGTTATLRGALVSLGGPLAILTGGLLVAYTSYQAVSQTQDALTAHMDKQIIKLSGLEYAWLSLNRTLGTISDSDRQRLEAYEKQEKMLNEMIEKAKIDVPPLEKIFGLSPETIAKIKQQMNDVINIMDTGATNVANLGTNFVGTASQIAEFEREMIRAGMAVENFNVVTPEAAARADLVRSKADDFAGSIRDMNAQLVQHAKDIGVDMGLVTKYNYVTGQSTDTIIANNLELKKLINNNKPYQQTMTQSTIVTEQSTDAYAKWRQEVDQGIGSVDDFLARARHLDQIKKSLAQGMEQLRNQSRIQLRTIMDIESPEEEVDELIKEMIDDLPKKYEKKIELELDPEGTTESFKKAAATIISGIEQKIRDDDKLADAVAKTLIKNLPDTEEGNEIEKWLKEAIKNSDTGEILADALTPEGTITIPAELSFTSRFDGAMSPKDAAEQRAKGGGNTPVATVPVEGKITSIADIPEGTAGGGGFPGALNKNNMLKIAQVPVQGVVTSITFPEGVDPFGVQMATMIIKAAETKNKINQIFLELSGQLSNIWLGMATNWSAMMNSVGTNAESGRTQAITAFSSMVSQATSLFNKLASNWANTMNKMVSAAKSAVSRILSEINKLNKTVTTTHRIVTQRVNAAKGFQGVVSNPTTFNVAEGGRPEFVSVTPLKDFNGTQTVSSRMNIKGSKNETPTGNMPTPIIQVFLDGKQIKGEVVAMLARNQSALK